MKNTLRDFDTIYELSETKIRSLKRERAEIKHSIALKENMEVKDFISKILAIAEFMHSHDIAVVSTGIRYENDYYDKQRGKFKLKLLDKQLFVCKVRNSCTTPIFNRYFDEVNGKADCFSDEFYGKDMEYFRKGIIERYDDIMRDLQDEVLEGQQAKIEKLQSENAELRAELAS